MDQNLTKRILALMLSVVLLVGNVPAAVFATDEVPALENTAEATFPAAAETEVPTEPPAEETIAPTLPPVPEETTAPTEVPAEPAAPEETEPPAPEETVPDPTASEGGSVESAANDALASGNACGEDVTWRIADGILFIAGTGEMNDFEYNKAPWYASRDVITAVVVESGVTKIGTYAFLNLENLANASISGTVKRINAGAFQGCEALGHITIPYGVETIGNGVFKYCDALETVSLPDSLTTMGNNTFEYCKKLTSITIPGSLREIPSKAFSYCEGLERLTISYGVEVIGVEAFGNCEALTYVFLPGSVTTISDHAFRICEALETVEIPDSVTYIGEYSFVNCYKLKKLTIPGSVTSIGDNAFQSCRALESLIICEGVEQIGSGTFQLCEQLEYVELPESLITIASFAFYRTALPEVELPENLERIGSDAFSQCLNLTEITIPSSVTSLGGDAFSNCTALKRVRLSPNMTVINGDTFAYCKSLTSITVPRRIETIKAGAFSGCTSLTSIVLPGVKEFGTSKITGPVFGNCPNLTSIYLGKTLKFVCKSAFNGTPNLKDVYFEGSKKEWDAINVQTYNDYLLNAKIHYNVPIPADDFYDFKMVPASKAITTAFREELEIRFRLLKNGEPMGAEWTKPTVTMEDGDILEVSKWEMREGDWYVTLKPKMLGTEHVTFTESKTGDSKEVKITVEPSGLKEYLDNSAIEVINSGMAYAYYLGDPTVKYDYTRNGLRESVRANDKGIIRIPLGSFVTQGTHEISIQFVAIEGTELETPLPYKAKVTVKPLQFRQEWQLSMSGDAGVSFGGFGVDVGSFKAEAALGKFGIGAGTGAAITLSRSWEDGKETLELISDRSTTAKTGIESGITGEIKNVEVNAAHFSAGVDADGTVSYGLRIRNYGSGNKDHQKALAVFLFGEAVTLSKNNLMAKSVYEKLRKDAFNKSGIDTIEGSGAAATGTFDPGFMSLQIDDTPVFSMLEGSIEGSAAISQYNYKNGDAKYATAISTKQNLEWVSPMSFDGALGLDYLGKDITVEVKKENGEKTLETTSLGAEMYKATIFELGKRYRNDYNQYVFSGDALDELLDDTTNFRSYLNGRRIAIGNKDLTEMAEVLSSTKEPIAYNNQERNQLLHTLPIDFGLEVLAGVNMGVELSYVQTTEHTSKTGYAIDNEILITGDSPTNRGAVEANSMELTDLVDDMLNALADEMVRFVNRVGNNIQNGVRNTWSWIEGKATSTSNWIVSITCPNSVSGIGWNTSEKVDVTGVVQTSGKTRSRVSGIAATVGRPFVIGVTDNDTGKNITSLQADPLTFTISYTAEELAEANAADGELAMYCYEAEKDVFRYVGGTHDPEARTVTAQIDQAGQYILAVCVEVMEEEETAEEIPPVEEVPVTHTLTISQELVILEKGQTQKFTAETTWEEQRENIRWQTDDENILRVNAETGEVTALAAGSTYVIATVSDGITTLTARCRVDVTESGIQGIQLSTAKITTELYKTDYATFEVLLQLPENEPEDGTVSRVATMSVADSGMTMKSARFADETVAKLFELQILDDRNVQVVPTDYAVANPKEVKSSYKSAVIMNVEGEEYTGEVVTLTVKKTLPKLTAKVDAFNSFYSHQVKEIIITGGTVTRITADASKNTAKTTALPEWLTLNRQMLILNEKVPAKSASGKAYIMVETEQWRIPAAVTLSVKNTYKVPGLKLSATSVTLAKTGSGGAVLKLIPSNKKDTLTSLNVSNITGPAGCAVTEFNRETGEFNLKADVAGKITLNVSFYDTDKTLPLTLTVKTAAVAVKLGATSITLNRQVNDSTSVKVTSIPADYRLEDITYRLTATEKVNGKNTTVDKTDSGVLDIVFENGQLQIKTTADTPAKATYKLYVKSGDSKEVSATINVISGTPSVTFKASGSMDLSFPAQTATIKPTFKNYKGEIVDYDYTVQELKGSKVVNEDVTEKFKVTFDGTSFQIRCVDDDINIANTYKVMLSLALNDGSGISNTVNMKVKRTAVKLKLGATKLTLNKLIGDEGSIALTCATKGYAFTEPLWTVKNKSKVEVPEQLDIRYEDGKLYVATNEDTVYGMTYTVALQANDKAAAQNLTVSVPTEAKSKVTVSIKAAGKVDVIRDSSAITITPTYKNRLTASPAEEQLYIYGPADKYKQSVNELFDIQPNGKGGYTVTRADGAVLTTGTYKVKLAAKFGTMEVPSSLISMTVTMGSTKLTNKTSGTTMFAKDKNDRAMIVFDTTDAILNDIAKVEIKDSKQRDMLEVIDYGDGVYAIGFKDGKVHKNLLPTGKATTKAVTVTLNIYLEGNQTTKANTTASVKLTIVK